MDTKQIKTLEWLDSLKKYAREKQLSIRIIDGLEECKRKVGADIVDWVEVNHKVEDLLSSIEQKMVPSTIQNNGENNVSLKNVEEQIKRMAQRCQTENQVSVENIAERKNLVVKKTYDDLREITHTKAHLEELKDHNLYLHFYEKEKSEYERNGFQMLREFLQDINSNYDHMLDHIKSILSSIGGYKFGIGNEKIYYEFETKREGLNNRFINEILSFEIGGSKIMDLGQKTSGSISKKIKNFIRKRRLLVWVPLLILLFGLVIASVATREDNIEELQTQTVDSEEDGQSTWLFEQVKQAGEKAISSASTSAIANVIASLITFLATLIIALGSVLLAIILLIVVLYITYLKILRTWCNRRICTECEKYLCTELDAFIRSDPLVPALDEAIKSLERAYEEEYLTILNQIFSEGGQGMVNEEQNGINRFRELKESWNQIKYE